MGWEDFPEHLSPFEQHVADIEGLEDPDPVIVGKAQILFDARGLRVADVASVEIREDIENAHNGHQVPVILKEQTLFVSALIF